MSKILMKETAYPVVSRLKCAGISTRPTSVAIEMRLPMSSMTSMACWFLEPAVSMAIGVKMWVVIEFASLLAADPANCLG